MANSNGIADVGDIPCPTNPMVTPLLTDLYQFTMAYAYWKSGKHHERSVLVCLCSDRLLLLFIRHCNFSVDIPVHLCISSFRFDLFFRKNPFGGEYTVFAGIEECIRLIANFRFTEKEMEFLRSAMPTCEVFLSLYFLPWSWILNFHTEISDYATYLH